MSQNSLAEKMIVKRSVSPVAIGTTGTGQTGKIIDRKGYKGVEFIVEYGAITATNAAFTLVVKEGDVTSTMTSIADGDLIGTEVGAVPATGTRTSGSTKNVTYRLGYKGLKRYVQVFKLSCTATAGPPVSAQVLLYDPEQSPTSPTQ